MILTDKSLNATYYLIVANLIIGDIIKMQVMMHIGKVQKGGFIMGDIPKKHNYKTKFKRLTAWVLFILCFFRIDEGLFMEDCQAANISFVVLSKYSSVMNIGDKFYLAALTSGGKKPVFKSSNSKVASVNTYGLVTAKKGGTANITVKIKGSEAVCRIKVNKTVISLDNAYLSMENGETKRIRASTSNGAGVTYMINKKSIALVDENGYVTGVKPGEAVVTVQADGYSKTCRILVRRPTITLSKSQITLYRGQQFDLKAKVSSGIMPAYRSNKKSVATADSNGTITAVKHGTAVITVKADGVSKMCTVTVKKPTISLNTYEITLQKGKQYCLQAKVSSGNKPEYSSGNTSVAVVDKNGRIKAAGKGKTYIYVNEDGTKVKCRVIVK